MAATLVAALLGAAFLLWRATRQPDRPLVQFSVNLGPGAVNGALPVISPDGSRIVFPSRGAEGKQRLSVRLLSQRQATPLPGTEDAGLPFFSPDGQWIAFFADAKLKKVPVTGGIAAATICEAPWFSGWWGDDGYILLGMPDGMARVSSAGGKPERLPDPPGEPRRSRLWPQLLPGGKSVLFTSSGTYVTAGDEDFVGVASLSTGKTKILERGGFFGRYLPSGHLVFARDNTLFALPFDLASLEPRGTPVPVFEDLATRFQFASAEFNCSQNGTAAYAIADVTAEQHTVAWVDRTGKSVRLLSTPAQYADPHISPDGSRLAIAMGTGPSHDVYVDDIARGNLIRITFTGRERQPIWAPDGKHLVYDTEASTGAIWWIRADGAGSPQPLVQNASTLIPYSFSPDGRLAYATASSRTSVDIWTLPLDLSDPEHPKPGKPELFLGTPFGESSPAFSPDGRWMAYLSNESGVMQLYVRPFPGPGGRWLISSGVARSPVWSRTGHELLYEASNHRVMSVAYTAKGDIFVAETPRPWPGPAPASVSMLSTIDVSPDGKRLVYFEPRENAENSASGSRVTFVLNFFDELRRKAPVR
jgi:serine/threonine-protein kinase